MSRTHLGELEEQVALVLLRLGGEGYAMQVAVTLSELTGRDVSPATTFMVMRRLEARRLVSSRVVTPDPSWGGRPRRLYRVDRRAVVPLLRASRRARLTLWRGFESLLK
jgi:DNA-binding PadR family transcriptional regulator